MNLIHSDKEISNAILTMTSNGITVRDKILELQDNLLKMTQIDCPVKHHFAPDSYGREIFIPAGTLIIGKIHRHAHLNVISQGECYVLTEDGVNHYKAPLTFTSFARTKRVVYAVNDLVWTTCHVTKETDLEKIENELIAPTYNDLDINLLAEVII